MLAIQDKSSMGKSSSCFYILNLKNPGHSNKDKNGFN